MRKSDIINYATTSKIMDITITYGGEKFSFNLNRETIISEDRINTEVKEQPSAYAFLAMLHKKLNRVVTDKKRQVDKVYAIMFTTYKKRLDENTGRPTANDVAKEKAIASSRYQNSMDEYISAQHDADIIEVCVRTFEQRQFLLQTLSANIRKSN